MRLPNELLTTLELIDYLTSCCYDFPTNRLTTADETNQ